MTEQSYRQGLAGGQDRILERASKQFGIVPIEAKTLAPVWAARPVWHAALRQMGVWGVQRLPAILQGPYAVVCGLKAGRLHLGHLDLLQQSAFWDTQDAEIYLLIGTGGAGLEDSQLVEDTSRRALSLLSGLKVTRKPILIHPYDPKWSSWEGQVTSRISLNLVRRLFGWSEHTSLADIRSVALTVTAFLIPQLILGRPIHTLVPCGVNEAPHVELARIVARRLDLHPPATTYHSYIDALDSSGRMSSKRENATIFLDDPAPVTIGKWEHARTGGRARADHLSLGGEPENCCFLAAAASLLSEQMVEEVATLCRSGRPCRDCKISTIPLLTQTIGGFVPREAS